MLKNMIVKALIYGEQVRFYFIDNTQLLREVYELNEGLSPSLKLLLGEAVSVMSILPGTLKGNQRMSLQVTLSNPVYKIFAEAEANGNVRGYLNEALLSAPDLEERSMKELIGLNGMIRIIKGSDMSQFTSITDMPNQNITGDIANYFLQSDQTSTFLHTAMQLGKEGSLLFSHAVYAQLLPSAPAHLLSKVESAIENDPHALNRLTIGEPSESEEVLNEFFGDAKVIGSSPSQFFCGCTKEMFYGMLYSLSTEEIEQSLEQNEGIETFCHICGRTYTFSQEDIHFLL